MNVTGTGNAGCRDLQLRQSRTSWLDPASGLIVDESVVDETVSSFPVRSNVTAQLFSGTPA